MLELLRNVPSRLGIREEAVPGPPRLSRGLEFGKAMADGTSTTCQARAVGTKRVPSQSTDNGPMNRMPPVDVTRRVILPSALSYPVHLVVDRRSTPTRIGVVFETISFLQRRTRVETTDGSGWGEFDDATCWGLSGPCTSRCRQGRDRISNRRPELIGL